MLIFKFTTTFYIHICHTYHRRSFEVAATDKINREEIKKLSDTLTGREMEIKSLLVSTHVRSLVVSYLFVYLFYLFMHILIN